MFPESHSLPVATGGLISKCVVAGSDFSMWAIVSLSNILFVSVILQTKEDQNFGVLNSFFRNAGFMLRGRLRCYKELEYLKRHSFEVAGIASSVQRFASDWTVRGSNPGMCEVLREIRTGPETHSLSCRIDTGSFRGVKQQANRPDRPPSYDAELRIGRSSPSVPAQTCRGVTFTFTYRRL